MTTTSELIERLRERGNDPDFAEAAARLAELEREREAAWGTAKDFVNNQAITLMNTTGEVPSNWIQALDAAIFSTDKRIEELERQLRDRTALAAQKSDMAQGLKEENEILREGLPRSSHKCPECGHMRTGDKCWGCVERERNELRAALPKTADGVTVVPGDTAFYNHNGTILRMVVCTTLDAQETDQGGDLKTNWWAYPCTHEGYSEKPKPCGVVGRVTVWECYSTRAAAEAAQEGGG